MYLFTASFALLASTLLAGPAAALPQPANLSKRTLRTTSENEQIISKLLLAPTGRDRIDILTHDDDFTFDFKNPPTDQANATGLGGHTITANRKSFPGLIGTGSSMTVGFLGPCAMNTPHTHPRGTELNIVVQGALQTTFIAENRARVVSNRNTQYQMAVFPQGALHQEFNPDCEDAVFVAAFNNEDAATLQNADAFFQLPAGVIKASVDGDITVDGKDLEAVRNLIPSNVALGVEKCLKKCGIQKRSLPVAET